MHVCKSLQPLIDPQVNSKSPHVGMHLCTHAWSIHHAQTNRSFIAQKQNPASRIDMHLQNMICDSGGLSVLGGPGWRFVFLSVALVSISSGILNWLFAHDPNFALDGKTKLAGHGKVDLKEIWRETKVVMCIPTFLLIVLQVCTYVRKCDASSCCRFVLEQDRHKTCSKQDNHSTFNDNTPDYHSCVLLKGIMGSIPWNALLFLTLYFQLLGMSDFSASLLVSLFYGAVALGNLLGGWVGDQAASQFPNGGRIAVTQFSVFVGIPLSWILVKVSATPVANGSLYVYYKMTHNP